MGWKMDGGRRRKEDGWVQSEINLQFWSSGDPPLDKNSYYGMFYKVELICHHPPHQCRCRHNTATEIDRDDLTQNLIKCNPALLKYLARTNTTTNTHLGQPTPPPQQQAERALPKSDQPYRSIVQEKGLNFILRNNFVSQPNNQPNKPTSPRQRPPQPLPQQTKPKQSLPDPITQNKSISPKAPKHIPSAREKQIKDHHKDMKNQSRYLSNTAFRKYFDRQCFENYGNQNVHHKADGFVYGNYLKTYNINPHTGHNLPNNQETFYHALVTASPEKYAQTQEIRLVQTGKTHIEGEKQPIEKSSLERDPINVQKMLQDNMKHSKLQKKYEHIKLKPKVRQIKQIKKGSVNGAKSQGKPAITPIHQSNYSPFSPKHQLPLQSRNHLPHPQQAQQLQPVQQSQYQHVKPSGLRPGSRAQSIIQTVQPSIMEPINKPPIAPVPHSPHCSHQPNQQTADCECCLNQMKGLILSIADSDPDLASRIVASAKKATLYKNFTLNNYQQAAMNPHNYTNSGKLNIYQPL